MRAVSRSAFPAFVCSLISIVIIAILLIVLFDLQEIRRMICKYKQIPYAITTVEKGTSLRGGKRTKCCTMRRHCERSEAIRWMRANDGKGFYRVRWIASSFLLAMTCIVQQLVCHVSSSDRSCHAGLKVLMRSIFFWREPLFSCFSLAIAKRISGHCSKYTSWLRLYFAEKDLGWDFILCSITLFSKSEVTPV